MWKNMVQRGRTRMKIRIQFYMGVKLGLSHLTEDHRLRMFQTRMLRKMFECKRDEVTGERREIHNKELHDCRLLFTKYLSFYRVNEDEMGKTLETCG